jgi:hypothetical protein
MNLYLPDPTKMLMAFAGALLILLAANASADAIYFTEAEAPGVPENSQVQWVHAGGSLPTVPRPADTTAVAAIPILQSPPDQDIAWTYNIGIIIEGWFKAVAEAGAMGGIPG